MVRPQPEAGLLFVSGRPETLSILLEITRHPPQQLPLLFGSFWLLLTADARAARSECVVATAAESESVGGSRWVGEVEEWAEFGDQPQKATCCLRLPIPRPLPPPSLLFQTHEQSAPIGPGYRAKGHPVKSKEGARQHLREQLREHSGRWLVDTLPKSF